MFIIKYRAVFFLLSVLLVAGSIVALVALGLRLSPDFTGGVIMEVEYPAARPAIEQVRQQIVATDLAGISVQELGERGLLLRTKELTDDQHRALLSTLAVDKVAPLEKRFSSIGPAVGRELKQRGLTAIAIVVALIILYITWAFRGVSRPVQSWKYGLIAIVALLHDITIPTGVFALLSHFYGVEADALFLTALLTILALSVNDTIVVFDRIRERLRGSSGANFPELVGRSLDETIVRSINTSLTVILVLLAIFFFGSQSTKYFSLILAIGMIVGTYSSIFIASPLLVVWEKFSRRVK
ncbi:MAG: protein translocase subunit SecF [Patescibacteria group bacterium]